MIAIISVPSLKVLVNCLETTPTHLILEAVVEEEVDEHHICVCSDAVDRSALVLSSSGSQVFSGGMSDYLFLGGVCLSSGVSIGVSVGACMVSGFVMVALGVKPEMPISPSEPFVVSLKILAFVNVAEVGT